MGGGLLRWICSSFVGWVGLDSVRVSYFVFGVAVALLLAVEAFRGVLSLIGRNRLMN